MPAESLANESPRRWESTLRAPLREHLSTLKTRLARRSPLADILVDFAFETRIGLQVREGLRHPEWQAAARSTDRFIEGSMGRAIAYPSRWALLQEALRRAPGEGELFEFGVHRGSSLRFIAGGPCAGRRVYGFDSFQGLPSDWSQGSGGVPAGRFKVARPPRVPPNVTLVTGWFEDSLPAFLGRSSVSPAFLHIDSDLYSSARTVLDLLGPLLKPGTPLVFDEFFGYPGWEAGEAAALSEAEARFRWDLEFFGFVRDKVGVVITGVRSP
jgi:Methyltransferase domain